MFRNSPGKINRNLGAERMAIARCTSEEAAKTLQTHFDADYEVAKKASRKRLLTQEQNEREKDL